MNTWESLVKYHALPHSPCCSNTAFCFFRSSMSCWWVWFFRLINWMYSVALSRICAREAWRFKQANYEFCFVFSCFPAFSGTVLTRLYWVLFLGWNKSITQLTKGPVYPDPTRLYSLSFLYYFLSFILTFSPCKAGTESRKPWKLSLMWSLRLRSSALWCARLSACKVKGQIEEVPRELCEDNICKLCCFKLTRLHTKGHCLLHFKGMQLVYKLLAQLSCLTWFMLQYERKIQFRLNRTLGTVYAVKLHLSK